MAEFLVLVDDVTKKFTKMIPITSLPHKTYKNLGGVDYVNGDAIPNETEVDAKDAAVLAKAGGALSIDATKTVVTYTPENGDPTTSVTVASDMFVSGDASVTIDPSFNAVTGVTTTDLKADVTKLNFSVVPVDTTCIAYAACP